MHNKVVDKDSRKVFLTLALGVGLLAGCHTPDLKPFRDSTAKIQNSVVEAQDLYSGELERLRPFVPNDNALTKQQRIFSENWKARTEVMDAMVKYAGSLAAVADAPEQSKAGLEGVAKSINQLGVAAGPYQAATEGGTEIALELVDLVNRVRAAQQLKKAVVATDPDVQKLAKLLAKDFGTLRRTIELNQKSIKNWMDGPVSRQLDARAALIIRAEEKATALQTNLGGTNWAAAVATFNQDMAETQKFLAEADKWYLPHQAAVEAAQKQMTERIKLFRDTETAIAQWGKAHADLAEALQNDMSPDWTLLRQSADRIQKSINKIENQTNTP
jgi:hypothetical protein